MTICLAIKCKRIEKKKEIESLLFASDTQESSMFIKRSVTKLRILFGQESEKHKDIWGLVVASSGDALVVDEAIDDIMVHLGKAIKPHAKMPSISLRLERKKIGDLAYATYKKFKDRGVENPHFELLFGAADIHSTILHVTYEGKSQLLGRYGVIGSGRVTGGELLLGEFLREEMSEDAAARLAALVITTIGHIDITVGGQPQMYLCSKRKVWKYGEEQYRALLNESELRWALIKKAWDKMQKDKTLENKLSDMLKE